MAEQERVRGLIRSHPGIYLADICPFCRSAIPLTGEAKCCDELRSWIDKLDPQPALKAPSKHWSGPFTSARHCVFAYLLDDGSVNIHGLDNPAVKEWCQRHGVELTIMVDRVADTPAVVPGKESG